MLLSIPTRPNAHAQVAWLDSDTFFTNKRWVEEASLRLDVFAVVQPWAWLVRLAPHQTWLDPSEISLSRAITEHSSIRSASPDGGLMPFKEIWRGAGWYIAMHGLHTATMHAIQWTGRLPGLDLVLSASVTMSVHHNEA